MIVFDIETTPDRELIKAIHNKTVDEYKLECKEKVGHDFLKIIYHKIISIGVTILNKQDYTIEHTRSTTVGVMKNNTHFKEEDLITRFDGLLGKTGHDTIVSYNGKAFDIPVIMRRSMKYKIPLIHLNYSPNQYKSYTHKFNDDMHLDLVYITPERLSLQESCMMCGFSAKKNGIDGSVVDSLSPEDVDKYVKIDCLSTTKLLYHYLLMRNIIDRFQFEQLIHQKALEEIL